jgi:hypothetical protein
MLCNSALLSLNRLVPNNKRFPRDALSSDSSMAVWFVYRHRQYMHRLLAFAPSTWKHLYDPQMQPHEEHISEKYGHSPQVSKSI